MGICGSTFIDIAGGGGLNTVTSEVGMIMFLTGIFVT